MKHHKPTLVSNVLRHGHHGAHAGYLLLVSLKQDFYYLAAAGVLSFWICEECYHHYERKTMAWWLRSRRRARDARKARK